MIRSSRFSNHCQSKSIAVVLVTKEYILSPNKELKL